MSIVHTIESGPSNLKIPACGRANSSRAHALSNKNKLKIQTKNWTKPNRIDQNWLTWSRGEGEGSLGDVKVERVWLRFVMSRKEGRVEQNLKWSKFFEPLISSSELIDGKW